MFAIHKDFHFSAGHHITGLPLDHKCSRKHGHNYIARLYLASTELDPVGFVVDFGELSLFKKWLDDKFDHRYLNDFIRGSTTAEHLAFIFYYRARTYWPQVYKVGVCETPKAWAYYRGDQPVGSAIMFSPDEDSRAGYTGGVLTDES